MTQGVADSSALIVSIIALIVAVVAAGFTGWQAMTAHLARTRPTQARWTFEYPPQTYVAQPWRLHNTGGSIAADVTIRLTYPEHDGREEFTTDFSVPAPIKPGESAPIPGSESRGDPRQQFYKVPGTSTYQFAAANTVEGAVYPMAETARVSWRDYRGRTRTSRVRLR